jgi:poly(beta-D-mannuronate) lyase
MVIANNIIQGGGTAGDFSGPMGGAMWEGNLLSGTSAGGLQGQTTLDAKLVKEGGVFRLAADSPAIGKAVGNYPYAGEDMDRQPRAGTKAPGADEPSTAPSRNGPLTPADVGPNAGL